MNAIAPKRLFFEQRINWQLAGLLLLGIMGGAAVFPGGYLMSSNVLIGFCLFPFALFIDGARRFNYVYLGILAIFLMLAYRYDIKIFYFFALALYILLILEAFAGRINSIILFLIAVASPVFTQISVILSFPIRLTLSNWACVLLSMVGLDIRAEGNMILLSGYSFTVDEACMGLSMMAISLLMGVFIITYQYRRTGHHLSFSYLISFFTVLFCLNIMANLFRIMLLVLFRIPQEHAMHEMVGLLCLLFYTVVPLYFLSQWIIRRKGIKSDEQKLPVTALSNRWLVMLLMIGVMMAFTGFFIEPVRTEAEAKHAHVRMPNMAHTEIDGGITKLTNDDLLIYVKPIPEFFTGEHTPLICWKGSGFSFKQVKKDRIAGREIFTGLLVKGNSQLYTSWWYTDGYMATIDQFVWRSEMLTHGKSFCLVNITASNELVLKQNLESIFSANLLSIE